jgi:hypothetical protein
MPKVLLTAISFFVIISTFSQTDSELKNRLKLFMEANNALNFERIMDYTYPKLFTIVTREQMIEVMNNTFNNDEIKISMDSLKVDSVYKEFKLQANSYAKIKYSMKLVMKFKEDTTATENEKNKMNESMLAAMQGQFGKANVITDSAGCLHIKVVTNMVAIKDEYAKEWCFVNLKEGDPLTKELLTDELLDKLATYK